MREMTQAKSLRFAVYRINGAKPGCIDFLGEFDAISADDIEVMARLMFDFDWGTGDQIDVQELGGMSDHPAYE